MMDNLNNVDKKSTSKVLNKASEKLSNKLFIFRILVISSLLVAATLCGTFAYYILRYEETDSFETQYHSLADQILQTTFNRLLRARSSLDDVATTHSTQHPNSTVWPFAFTLGYDDIHEHISKISNVIALAMGPLVKPEEVTDFENYVRDIYLTEPYKSRLPEGVTLDLGVYGRGPNGTYRDTTGEVEFSQYNFITPLLNVGNLSRSGSALLFNLHAERNRAEAIDASYECSVRSKKPCTVMTDIIQLVSLNEPRPDTILVRAVYPYIEPEKLVGFLIISLSWRDMLTGLVPGYVCGLDAILSTETQKFTYQLCDGKATPKCSGDCHESRFDYLRKIRSLNLPDSEAIQPHDYRLELYPSLSFYDSYHSNIPWISTIIVVVVILFTSLVFIGYDNFVAKDSREKQEVLEAKRRFVRFVSHEIRTPICTLVLGLKLLADNVEELPPYENKKKSLRQMTQELEDCSNVAVMVLNDLLQYDKIESGSMKLDMKEVRISNVMKSNVHLFRSSAAEKQIEIIEDLIDVQDQLGVLGDELRLIQVIGNLMSNAIKFSTIGSSISVKSSIEDGPLKDNPKKSAKILPNLPLFSQQKWFLFSVTDTGLGISAENLEKLFGEGVQFNPNELQGGQGSGLGLWISRGIIELHGGHIWGTSEGEGRGCTFFFELPLIELTIDIDASKSIDLESNHFSAILTDPTETREEFSSEQIIIESIPSHKMTLEKEKSVEIKQDNDEDVDNKKNVVLIVDDVPMLRKMMNRSFQMKGYECVEAADGKECVEMIKNGLSVSCILMDFQMPFMNGPEATKELRKLGCKMPILGVTGNVMPEDVKEFLQAGVDKVISKPFKMSEFEEFMKRLEN